MAEANGGDTQEQNRQDILAWKAYLNEVVGLFCVAGFLSSMASPRPSLYAAVHIVIILLFSVYKQLQLHSEFAQLSRKLNKTVAEKYNLKVLVSWHFNLIADIKENIVFICSFALLVFAVIWGCQLSEAINNL